MVDDGRRYWKRYRHRSGHWYWRNYGRDVKGGVTLMERYAQSIEAIHAEASALGRHMLSTGG